jgi:hypothetical protein
MLADFQREKLRMIQLRGGLFQKLQKCLLAGCAVGALASPSNAAVEIVSEFLAPVAPGSRVVNAWYAADVRPGGTASIESLVGAGGNLESNQPLPIGAAKLTTSSSNDAKAEVSTYQNFGLASVVLRNIDLAYGYYKTAGGNAEAAPSIKLTLASPGGTGDNFGTLIYEPYWNQGVDGSVPPPTDAWQSVMIDENTGSGGTGGGGWWWNGGFGQPNSGAGPPIRSLAEWADLFASSSLPEFDFAQAIVTTLSVGIGTFNAGQINYFDNVSISIDGAEATVFNFEPAAVVPELSALVTWGVLALSSIISCQRRR